MVSVALFELRVIRISAFYYNCGSDDCDWIGTAVIEQYTVSLPDLVPKKVPGLVIPYAVPAGRPVLFQIVDAVFRRF